MQTENLINFEYVDDDVYIAVRVTHYKGNNEKFLMAYQHSISNVPLSVTDYPNKVLALDAGRRLVAAAKADLCSLLSEL